jgi:hypothetical protein
VALTPCSDLAAADWIVFSVRPWQQLVCFGPEGFPAYARLRFLFDPAHEGQRDNDVDLGEGAATETALLRAAIQTLTRHTRTPDDCYFCLWDGWGADLQGGGGVFLADWRTRSVRPGPRESRFGRPVEVRPCTVVRVPLWPQQDGVARCLILTSQLAATPQLGSAEQIQPACVGHWQSL